MIVITIIGVLAAILLPNLARTKYLAQLSACESQLRNLAAALENYSTDYKGFYPDNSLDVLFSQKYMNKPVCPSNRSEYGYTCDNSQGVHRYTIWCNGWHHTVVDAVEEGYPQYQNDTGLNLRKKK